MPFALVCVLALALVGASLSALAVRYEHLVVLSFPRAATFFLERRAGGRYQLVPAAQVPLVVLRFAAHALSLAPGAARRAASRVGSRAPFPVGGKA